MAEIDRLVVVFDAKFDRLEQQLNKVVRSNYGAASKVEKAWKNANDNMGRGFVKGELQRGLDALSSRAPAAAGGLNRLGAAGLTAGAALGALALALNRATEAMNFGDELQTAASKIQISAEALQELQFVAGETNVPIEALRSSLEKLNGSIGAIKTGVGDGRVKDAFAALKISKEELEGITNATDLLPLLADRLGQVEDATEQVQIARKLGIEELLPLLRLGSDGIAELTQRAHELGLVLDNETVKALADADRQMELASEQINTNLRAAFAGLAVDVAHATGMLAEFIVRMRKISAEMPGLVDSIAAGLQVIHNPVGAVRSGLRARQAVRNSRVDPAAGTVTSAQIAAFLDLDGQTGFELADASKGGGKGRDTAKQDAQQREARRRRVAEQIYRAELDVLEIHNDERRATEDRLIQDLDRLELERKHRKVELDLLEADYRRSDGKEGIEHNERVLLEQKEEEVRSGKERNLRDKAALDLVTERLRHEERLAGFARDVLGVAESMATTQAERRRIQLQILDSERAELRTQLDRELSQNNDLTPEQRQAQLDAFDTATNAQRQGVLANTRGPIEDYFASLPKTAEEVNEAMERLAVEGFQSLEDAIVDLASGTRDAEDILRDFVRQMLAEFTRLNVEAFLGKASGGQGVAGLLNSFMGMFGKANLDTTVAQSIANNPLLFDRGGWTGGGNPSRVAGLVHGQEFVVKAGPAAQYRGMLEAINAGRRLSPSSSSVFSPTLHIGVNAGPGMTSADARRTGQQIGAAAMERMAEARKKGYR